MHGTFVLDTTGISSFERQLEQATKRALEQAAVVALDAVKSTPTSYKIASIMDTVFATGVEHTSKGLGVWLIAGDWRSLFFERGTYKRHRGKLSPKTVARRLTPSGQERITKWRGNRGVKAVHFLRHGARAGQAVLLPLLERECSRIR